MHILYKMLALIACMLMSVSMFAGCNRSAASKPTTDPNITPAPTETPADIDSGTVDFITQQWVALEISFESSITYTKPLYQAELDVLFTAPTGEVMKMPGFWDGGTTWKVRFAPTMYGVWTYKTTCTDTANTGLNGQEGKIGCNIYKGDLAIYQHGFVKAETGKRYFMYADGTPFFYLGDTHWTMSDEDFDSSEVEGIASQFKYLVDKRVEQGFTVYQSEPLGAKYNLANGLSLADLEGFADLDRRFAYIAEKGLVHSNSQLLFTSVLDYQAKQYPADYLAKLSRYWVARYGAYPVLWTTAQECDNDYSVFDPETNPWKTVFNAVHECDPYQHPQSAHQEFDVTASDSAFIDLPGYAWIAAQKAHIKNGQLDFTVLKDYWNNGGQRPVIDYEAHYENLHTNEFGARMQGWVSFLNGMFGHGYGAQDIWAYNSTYSKNDAFEVFGITITKEMKNSTWDVNVNLAAATELGQHMKNFFQSIEWWMLEPCFDDAMGEHIAFYDSWYSAATIGNEVYVAYFYNTTTATGKLVNLEAGKTYTASWYNPRTGQYTEIANNVVGTDPKSSWQIPDKPDGSDWVLYVALNED